MRTFVLTTFVLALLLGFGAVIASAEETPATETQTLVGAADEASAPAAQQLFTFAFEPAEGRSFEGWAEVGRAAGEGGLHRIGVLGRRLVAIGNWTPAGEEFDYSDRAWSSDDGWTWAEATLPGGTPQVTDAAVRPDGSMAVAVGYTEDDWSGAVWVTTDALEWEVVTPPSTREVDAVAVSNEVVAVAAGYRLWTTMDFETWERVKGPRPVSVAYGPGGFLTVEGGGQDLVSPTAVWHSVEGVEWEKVRLPKALRNAAVGISTFPLDDEWVIIPDIAKLAYTSPDGLRWRRAPRPPGMHEGYVSWMAGVGEVTQAYGALLDRKTQPSGLWTFVPGRRVAKPRSISSSFVDAPVEWDDGYLGLGVIDGDDDVEFLAQWRHEGSEPEEAVGSLPET